MFRTAILTLAAICLAGSSYAATIGYADAIDRLAASCGDDVQKYCKGVAFGNGGIQNCLLRNQGKVSNQCQATFAEVFALIEKRAAAQAAAPRLCRDDAARRCQGVQAGEGHLLSCLLKAGKVVSSKCNQALTDAGWR